MRASAILINTARGPVVDQAALVRGVGLGGDRRRGDRRDRPWPPAPDDPLLAAPNLIVVPHIGSATRAARTRMTELAVENLLAALDGRLMAHPAGR